MGNNKEQTGEGPIDNGRYRTRARPGVDYFYHYTNLKGLRGILNSKKILPSKDPCNIKFGAGVYMTELGPDRWKSLTQLKENNYADLEIALDRVSYFIALAKSSLKVAQKVVDKKRKNRNIWLLRTKDPVALPNDFYIGRTELKTGECALIGVGVWRIIALYDALMLVNASK